MDVCGSGKASIKIYSLVTLLLCIALHEPTTAARCQNPTFQSSPPSSKEEKPHCHTYHDFLDFPLFELSITV
jgi:hypothetical protein